MCGGTMEPEDEKKKKLNDDVVVFMRKRSETETPRYTARLKTYVDIQQKHRRAAEARRHTGGYKAYKASAKKEEQKLPTDNAEHANDEDRMSRRIGGRTGEKTMRMNSFSRSQSAPSDRCGRRRRRRSRCRRKRRRRSCGRRRRRRRSCGRRRRRRRSCGRRRRRRSCGRRRRRRRRSCRRRRRSCRR